LVTGISITAHLCFNEAGELVNFTSNNRYNADAGKKLPWATPIKKYKVLGGYKLPSNAETIYTYSGGEVCYGIFEISSIKYNCMEFK
jgi:hypothetical protein